MQPFSDCLAAEEVMWPTVAHETGAKLTGWSFGESLLKKKIYTMENSRVLLQKIKNKIPIRPKIPTSGYGLKRIESRVSQKYCTLMSASASFTPAGRRKRPECPVDEWIDKMRCIRATEHDSPLKRMGFLTRATTWTSPEDSMRSELSQSQKNKTLCDSR